MLESQKFYSLFSPNQKIYTKVKNEEPTYYANTSKVSTSQFASVTLAPFLTTTGCSAVPRITTPGSTSTPLSKIAYST
ncbi:glycogen biosynthesis protein [Streptococcus pneumoniae]|nr:glycogen biosynthesis protein [Streptococcus pneumoniae]